nr:uncharacterized protein LOC112703217 isoform X1 [Arachis hypogaea]
MAVVAILVVDDGMVLVVVAATARDVIFVADAVVMDTEDKAAGESRSVNEVLYRRDMGIQHSNIERKILKLIFKRYRPGGIHLKHVRLELMKQWLRRVLFWWWMMVWFWWWS